jgi:hypothetical protein
MGARALFKIQLHSLISSSLPSTNEVSSLRFDEEQGWSQKWAERPCKLRNPSFYEFETVADNVEKTSQVFSFFSPRESYFAVFPKKLRPYILCPGSSTGYFHTLPHVSIESWKELLYVFEKRSSRNPLLLHLRYKRLVNLFPCPMGYYIV